MGLERAAGDAWWGDVTNVRGMEMTIEERVKNVVGDELGIAREVSIVERLEDLGADSHDRQSLTLALEVEFDLEIPDGDGQVLDTVDDIVRYVERRTPATA